MDSIFLYLIVDALALFFLFVYLRKSKFDFANPEKSLKLNKHFIYLAISFSLLAGLVIFRDASVGVDYKNVGNAFVRIVNNIEVKEDIEWFGLPLVYLCKFISIFIKDSVFGFYAIIGFLSVFFTFKAILTNSKKPVFSLFLFIVFCLYYQMFNQCRQMLAVSIILCSLKYLKDRNFWKYTFVILCATAIHNTAIIMLPVYFFANKKVNTKTILFYTLSAMCIFVLSPFFEYLILQTDYAKYINSIYDEAYVGTTLFNFVYRVLLLLCCYYFYPKMVKKDKNVTVLMNLGIYCTILQVAAIKYYFLARLTTYFYVFYIFLIPEVYKHVSENLKTKNGKFYLFTAVILFFIVYHIVYYYSSSGASGSGYLVYKFIFQ